MSYCGEIVVDFGVCKANYTDTKIVQNLGSFRIASLIIRCTMLLTVNFYDSVLVADNKNQLCSKLWAFDAEIAVSKILRNTTICVLAGSFDFCSFLPKQPTPDCKEYTGYLILILA